MTARTITVAAWTHATQTGPSTTLVEPAKNIPAGTLMRGFVRGENADVNLTVSDSAGGTWHVLKSRDSNVTGWIVYSYNHPGGASVVITSTFSGSQSYRSATFIGHSGSDATDPLQPGSTVTSDGELLNHNVAFTGAVSIFSGQANYSTTSYGTNNGAILGSTNWHGCSLVDSVSSSPQNITYTDSAGGVASVSAAFSDPSGGSPATMAADAAAVASATAALSVVPAGEIAITALLFPGKYSSDANARMKLTGTDLPNRFAFTITGSVNFNQHSSYYGMLAFFDDLGAGNWSGGHFEYLATPYATTSGAVDAAGLFTSTDGGAVHHWEIGGHTPLGSSTSEDRGAAAGGTAILARKGVWVDWIAQVAVVNIAGTDYAEARLWPDIEQYPNTAIIGRKPLADFPTPTNPALAFGAYKWAPQTSTSNDEPLDGYLRSIRIIKGVLALDKAKLEMDAAKRGTGTWATTEASAFGGIILDNPTVASIAPFTWDNANRPADYSGTIVVAEPVLLAGDAAAQAGATASLLKGVSLSGAGLAVAGASASMSHTVPLAASAAAMAVAGGQLAIAVQLSGDAIASAAASAGLDLAVPLVADAAAQAGASADLSTSSGVDLAADAQASASSSAVLSLTVSLSADAVGQALASADLAKAIELGADGAAQADATASVQVGSGADLAANAQAQASAGASLWLDVPLGADALAEALAGGSLSLVVLLGADALANASGAGALAADVQLSAAGQVIANASAGLQVTGPISAYLRGFRARPPVRTWTARPTLRTFTARPPARI
jgi:hypothetical protein